MQSEKLEYTPLVGKTYTLFGHTNSTGAYYSTMRMLADRIVDRHRDIQSVLDILARYSTRKKTLKRLLSNPSGDSPISSILQLVTPYLLTYTEKTEEHLESIQVKSIWDRRLGTTREQYHLYMLEIELTNRLNKDAFWKSGRKIALTPYCLQDFSVSCRAGKTDLDYQCRHCSAKCFQNHASALLEKNHVEAYIWMGASIKKLAKASSGNTSSLAVLGIACIPELVAGMRKCRKLGLPVVGLPLNANRCVRWFGEFHQNSIDLIELENLVNPGDKHFHDTE